jgi:ubiquinone/menaquinone biosynthesis C-methylase UbiE
MTKTSTWGIGEQITMDAIKKGKIKGKWLDLAAGDGRYAKELLEKVDKLVLADADGNELDKIEKFLSKVQKKKTSMKIFDMTKKFPFEDNTFDGVFCAGTLHLFAPEKLESIFSEITRILKLKGRLIIDFATDVKLILPNGKSMSRKDHPEYIFDYTRDKVEKMLRNMLIGYDLKLQESTFEDDLTNIPEYGYRTRGNFFLVIAEKKLSWDEASKEVIKKNKEFLLALGRQEKDRKESARNK